jgi:multiple antibiotic resistance protein
MLTPEAKAFALLAFSSLFSVINPISAAPIFVAMTDGRSSHDRRLFAFRACGAALLVLSIFAAAGGAIFAFFGITVPAFQIAGGMLFTLMSIRTLQSGKEDVPEDDGGRSDPSVVPLGIPLIAGPGAISTVMVLIGQAPDAVRRGALALAIGVNVVLTFLVLLLSPAIVTRIGATGQKIVTKVMGLITAVIGIQFVINGATTVILEILRSARA